ncbi:MAG: transposase [Atopobiaceae bacterium]|nr:transposase [Atopobiaceae bacterium]
MLGQLSRAFSRHATFSWFATFVVGLICRTDELGISSVVRALRLDANSYDSLDHMLHSTAWSAAGLRRAWYALVARTSRLFVYAGRYVLVSDGCKVAKEGVRMPGVKLLHQESETVSKPEFVFGHMFGAVGVMAGELGRCLCVPLKVNMQDGMRAAAGWDGTDRVGVSAESHVVQSVRCAFEAARGLGRRCLLAMDRYFLTVPALRTLAELNERAEFDGLGAGFVHVVTKAKGNFVAYLPPRPRPKGTRGRPPKKGPKVVVSKVLGSLVYEPVEAIVGAEGKRWLHAATLDLVWGKGLWVPVRVVVVLGPPWGGRAQILVTTDRTLSARQVIEVYCSRWKIECTFRDMKVDLCGFGYRHWSKAMPRLDRFAPKGAPDRLEAVDDPHDRELILGSYEATERHVAVAVVALGLVMILVQSEPANGDVAYAEFSRTPKAGAVSVGTMRRYLRDRVSEAVAGLVSEPMMRFIREHAVGEGGYAPKAKGDGAKGAQVRAA